MATSPETGKKDEWFESHANLSAALITLLGLLARLWAAHGTFLNPDEALHFRLANQVSLALAYKESLTAAHPPLLIVLLYYWRALGTSELWLRLPSVLAGAVFCWMFYKWLSKAAGSLAGFIGLLFVAFLPPIIQVAAELRQYSLLLAFLISALYFLDEAFTKNSISRMAAFTLCLYLAMLFHYSAFWFAAALGLYALFRIFTERPPAALTAAWALSQLGGLAIAAFLYKTHLSKLGVGDSRTPLQGLMSESYLQRSFFDRAHDNPLLFLVGHTFGVFQYFFGQLAVGDVDDRLVRARSRAPAARERLPGRPSCFTPLGIISAPSLCDCRHREPRTCLSLRRHAPHSFPDYPSDGGRQRGDGAFFIRQMESRTHDRSPRHRGLRRLWQTAPAQDEPSRSKPKKHGGGDGLRKEKC